MEKSFVYYHYEPSLPAAIAAIALFGISSLLHLFQMVRSRTWFLIPFVLGCFCEYSLTAYAGMGWNGTNTIELV